MVADSVPDDWDGFGADPSGFGRPCDREPHQFQADHLGFPVREILSLGSARAVLAKLIEGDPLEIGTRCIEQIRAHALLLSVKQVHLRAVARVAHAAPRYRGTPALPEWLDQRIRESIEEVRREERAVERGGALTELAPDHVYLHVASALRIDKECARRACVAFNDLPSSVRHAFYSVVIEGKSVRRYVAEGNGPPSQVRAHLRSASAALRRRDVGRTPGHPR